MIELDVEINGIEYIKLNYAIVYRNPALIIVLAVAVVMLLVSTITDNLTTDSLLSSPVHIIALLVLAYVLLALPVILFYRVRTLYNTLPLLHERLHYTIDEKQIVIKGKTVKEKNPWKDYVTVKQTKNWVILWKAQNMGNFIPKTAFKNEGDLERLIEMATINKLKTKA